MKKVNNSKFRNNNNGNSIYSLNYKFDSVSSAGKFNGTALDLIKRYNELAKEAQSRGDYVDMEVYRQYAEHYRKIVTEINARKNQGKDNVAQGQNAQGEAAPSENGEETQPAEVNNNLVETEAAPRPMAEDAAENSPHAKKTKIRSAKRAFTVVEVTENENTANENKTEEAVKETSEKPKRRRLTVKKTSTEGNEATAQ